MQTLPTSLKLVVYLRTSSNEQMLNGAGLETQLSEIRSWASKRSHRLVGTFTDEALSGRLSLAERPALAEALTWIEDGKASGIVVQHLDRLARTLSGQEAIFAQVWSHGGRVFDVGFGEIPKDDPTDPMRTAMRQMMGVFAELERGMIRARLVAGAKRKRDNGGYAGGGVPYGSRVDKQSHELVSDALEQQTVALMRSLRSSGCSLRQIARELDAAGLPPRKGGSWHPYSIARTLERT